MSAGNSETPYSTRKHYINRGVREPEYPLLLIGITSLALLACPVYVFIHIQRRLLKTFR